MDLRRRNSLQTGAEGPGQGPSKVEAETGAEDRHGRENRPKRSAGGPKGPPGAHLGAKTWQQLDQPVVKALQDATEATQRG